MKIELTFTELTYLSILSLGILYVIVKTILSKKKIEIFSPIVFISLIFLIYTVIGPIVFLLNELNIFPKDFSRQFYETAWLGSVIAYLSILIGYSLPYKVKKRKKRNVKYDSKIFTIGLILNLTGLLLYTIVNPSRLIAQLNPFSAVIYSETEGGSFINYLNMAINFLIVGNTFLLLGIKKINLFRKKTLTFLIFLILTLGIYTTLGFRYRILLLAYTLGVSYYIRLNSRPSLSVMISGIFIFIVGMGIIGQSRTYGSGLDLGSIEGQSNQDVLIGAFRETNIFIMSGAVIKAVPEQVDFVYFTIIKNILIFPIPRTFIPNKDTDSYIRNPIKSYTPLARIGAHKWAATMYFAEWYIAFGWMGIIIVSLLLGRFAKRLWCLLNINSDNPYIIVTYSVNVAFLYLFLTRGYLPAITMIFIFTVFPSYIGKFITRFQLTK